MREIEFEYGFESINGIVKKVYHLHEIPSIQNKCDVWNVLPLKYVRQFTGLLDKKSKKIFEGDIVSTFHGQKYVCVFRGGGFEFENIITKNYAIYSELWDIEIIGNVTENPELLK